MAITDQQFEDWLRSPKLYAGAQIQRVMLAEAKYYPTGGPEATRYFATRPYTTTPSETPASEYYHNIIVEPPTFMARLSEVERIFSGFAPSGWGDIILDNTGGSRDSWLNDAWDGRDLTLYLGDASWAKSDFRTILVGYSADLVAPSHNRLALRIRDKTWATNVPLQTSRIGGSTDNKDKLVPLSHGSIFLAEPPLITAATHEYQVHDGPIATSNFGGVQYVYDNGVQLATALTVSAVDTGTETITTSANHGLAVDSRVKWDFSPPAGLQTYRFYYVISAGLTANTFRLSLTRGGAAVNLTGAGIGGTGTGYNWWTDWTTGKVYLTAAPAGRITCQHLGAAPGASAGTVSAVDTGTDTLTFSAPHGASIGERIVFAGTVPGGIVAGNDYWVYDTPASDTMRLTDDPAIPAILNITGSTTGATATRYSLLTKCADIIDSIVKARTTLTAADLDATSFSDFNTTCPQTLGDFRREFVTVGTAIDAYVASVGGFWTFGTDGKMYLGRFDAPSGSPVMELLADEIAARSFRVVSRILPIKKYTLGHARNFAPTADGLASSVDETTRAQFAREFQVVTASNAVTTMHLLAPETPEIGTLLYGGAEVQDEVDRRADLWSELRYIYELRCFAAPLKLRLGQVIQITHPRFGFSAGKLVTIVGMRWAPTGAGGVTLEVFA